MVSNVYIICMWILNFAEETKGTPFKAETLYRWELRETTPTVYYKGVLKANMLFMDKETALSDLLNVCKTDLVIKTAYEIASQG